MLSIQCLANASNELLTQLSLSLSEFYGFTWIVVLVETSSRNFLPENGSHMWLLTEQLSSFKL